MIANDLEVISSGANVPFDENEIFMVQFVKELMKW